MGVPSAPMPLTVPLKPPSIGSMTNVRSWGGLSPRNVDFEITKWRGPPHALPNDWERAMPWLPTTSASASDEVSRRIGTLREEETQHCSWSSSGTRQDRHSPLSFAMTFSDGGQRWRD